MFLDETAGAYRFRPCLPKPAGRPRASVAESEAEVALRGPGHRRRAVGVPYVVAHGICPSDRDARGLRGWCISAQKVDVALG